MRRHTSCVWDGGSFCINVCCVLWCLQQSTISFVAFVESAWAFFCVVRRNRWLNPSAVWYEYHALEPDERGGRHGITLLCGKGMYEQIVREIIRSSPSTPRRGCGTATSGPYINTKCTHNVHNYNMWYVGVVVDGLLLPVYLSC